MLLGRTPYLGSLAREGQDDRDAASRALSRLDLIELRERLLGTLSGGERQRVVVARALAQEAGIVILDEPTAALDIGHQQQALELLDDLREESGLTLMAAMHDLTLAAQYADRVALMDEGRIVSDGTPARGADRGEHLGALPRLGQRRQRGRPARGRTRAHAMSALSIQGVSSSAGKSLVTTALARAFSRRGIRVAPFKAQNMSNNARVVDGRRDRVAQYLQALAAGIEPDVRMNPILVKPEGDDRSQLVLLGKVDRQLSRAGWLERPRRSGRSPRRRCR